MGQKIKIALLINHVLFIYGILYLFNLAALLYFAIGYVLIVKIGVECGYHRLFSHQSFQTGKIRKNLLLYCGSLAAVGPPLAWAGVHRIHHRFSDTDKDPHGQLPAYRVWLTLWRDFIVSPIYIRDLLRDKWQLFFFRHYFKILLASYVFLGLISPRALVFGFAGASVIGFHVAGLVNTVCHRWGKRDFDTNDQSYNNSWVNLLVGGNGLHNNHHANPSHWDYRFRKGEVDLQAHFIKWVLILKPFVKDET